MLKANVYNTGSMTKITSNALGLALAISFGVLLVSAVTTSSLLGAPPSTGKMNSSSTMKSSNMTQSASMANKTGAGNMTKTTLSGQGTSAAPFAATSNPTGNMTKASELDSR